MTIQVNTSHVYKNKIKNKHQNVNAILLILHTAAYYLVWVPIHIKVVCWWINQQWCGFWVYHVTVTWMGCTIHHTKMGQKKQTLFQVWLAQRTTCMVGALEKGVTCKSQWLAPQRTGVNWPDRTHKHTFVFKKCNIFFLFYLKNECYLFGIQLMKPCNIQGKMVWKGFLQFIEDIIAFKPSIKRCQKFNCA